MQCLAGGRVAVTLGRRVKLRDKDSDLPWNVDLSTPTCNVFPDKNDGNLITMNIDTISWRTVNEHFAS